MKSPYTNNLAHATWECKYHIVFAPKFRRKDIMLNKLNKQKICYHILYLNSFERLKIPNAL